jgi:hypothetical protein
MSMPLAFSTTGVGPWASKTKVEVGHAEMRVPDGSRWRRRVFSPAGADISCDVMVMRKRPLVMWTTSGVVQK